MVLKHLVLQSLQTLQQITDTYNNMDSLITPIQNNQQTAQPSPMPVPHLTVHALQN